MRNQKKRGSVLLTFDERDDYRAEGLIKARGEEERNHLIKCLGSVAKRTETCRKRAKGEWGRGG